MKTSEIANNCSHRPWKKPNSKWSYYQEWNHVLFLHWKAEPGIIEGLIPAELKVDTFKEKAWVSLVLFNMDNIRPRTLPAFPPISNFLEINIRTYVKYRGKAGVYFLSIEGSKLLSCKIAKAISQLPYRYSKIVSISNSFYAKHSGYKDCLNISYKVGKSIEEKPMLTKWLTERYALFQDTKNTINEFEIHHIEWPLKEVRISEIDVNYPRFNKLIDGGPDCSQYSEGVQVLSWSKQAFKRH